MVRTVVNWIALFWYKRGVNRTKKTFRTTVIPNSYRLTLAAPQNVDLAPLTRLEYGWNIQCVCVYWSVCVSIICSAHPLPYQSGTWRTNEGRTGALRYGHMRTMQTMQTIQTMRTTEWASIIFLFYSCDRRIHHGGHFLWERIEQSAWNAGLYSYQSAGIRGGLGKCWIIEKRWLCRCVCVSVFERKIYLPLCFLFFFFIVFLSAAHVWVNFLTGSMVVSNWIG